MSLPEDMRPFEPSICSNVSDIRVDAAKIRLSACFTC
jgi:hypothetical protein